MPEPEDDEARMLNGVRDRLIVFGHSHQQFQRRGPDSTELLNPGSVGMPLDGDRRAAWAVRNDDGEFEFRRTEYDVEKAAAGYRSMGHVGNCSSHTTALMMSAPIASPSMSVFRFGSP